MPDFSEMGDNAPIIFAPHTVVGLTGWSRDFNENTVSPSFCIRSKDIADKNSKLIYAAKSGSFSV